MWPNEAIVLRIRICAGVPPAILKYIEQRRNSPPADNWHVLRFLAKGEAGDLLDKWA